MRKTIFHGIAIAVLLGGITGCASLSGAPKAIAGPDSPTDLGSDACPTKADVEKFDSGSPPNGLTRRQWRDRIIATCVDAADAAYAAFTKDLHEQATSVNLGTDLAALTLSGTAAVAGKNASNALAAASAGVLAAGASINKDVFYQKALPAIVAAMNANRTAVLVQIKRSERDNDVDSYTLQDARHDIREYVAAGTIDEAVTKITATADNAQTDSAETLHALFTAQIVDPPTQVRIVALNNYVRSLKNPDDKATLDAMADLLQVKKSDDFLSERAGVLGATTAQGQTKSGMDTLSALLKPATKRDF